MCISVIHGIMYLKNYFGKCKYRTILGHLKKSFLIGLPYISISGMNQYVRYTTIAFKKKLQPF